MDYTKEELKTFMLKEIEIDAYFPLAGAVIQKTLQLFDMNPYRFKDEEGADTEGNVFNHSHIILLPSIFST